MKIKWRDMFGTMEYESTAYEPTYITWPHSAPDPRDLREERDRYKAALEAIRDHGKTHDQPCWAISNGDCAEVMQETAKAALREQ